MWVVSLAAWNAMAVCWGGQERCLWACSWAGDACGVRGMRSHGAESGERGDDGNSSATAGTILPTSPSSLTTLTLAAAEKPRLNGVPEPARPAGKAAWTDDVVVDGPP